MSRGQNAFTTLKERRNEIITLYSSPLKSEYIWKTKPRSEIDKISIISDNMFHAMFNHPKGKKYIAYLLSKFLKIDNDKVLETMEIISNDIPKDKASSVSQRCDCVCLVDNTVITIEMNNNSSIEVLHRNMDYNNKQYNAIVKSSKDYDKYRQSILFNFNNFSFEGKEETYYISYLKDEEGTVLTDALIIINIYIPNLIKKCYNCGIEILDEIEKFIYALIEENEEKLSEIIKEMPIVKEYVKDAKNFLTEEEELKFNYDREQAMAEEMHKIGVLEGIEQGKEKTTIDLIKNMYANGVSIDIIAKSAKLSIDEVKGYLNV